MKKIFLLFVLAIATSACCGDDSVGKTPLEGRWKVEQILYGDPPPVSSSNSMGATNYIGLGYELDFVKNRFVITTPSQVSDKGIYTYQSNPDSSFPYLLKLISETGTEMVFFASKKDNNSLELAYANMLIILRRVK